MLLALLAQVADALDPLALAKLLFVGVRDGSLPVSALAAGLLVLVVALLRKFGPKLEAVLPDHTLADKVLAFIFKTKPGGWLLNLASSVAAAVATGLAAGAPPSWALIKPVLIVSVTAATVWELAKDLFAWWKERKAKAVALAAVP